MPLVSVGGAHTLEEKAAASYQRMRKAGCPEGITSSTRSYSQQKDWYLNQGKPGYPPMAANPDTSKHVWRPNDTRDKGARALDIPEPARSWVRAYGSAFGWMKDRVGGETWHMEYEIWNDSHQDDQEDDVTPEEIKTAVRSAMVELYDETANRSTGTGRAVSDDMRKIAADAPVNQEILAESKKDGSLVVSKATVTAIVSGVIAAIRAEWND